MLELNLKELLTNKGIDVPSRFLTQHGMSYHTANRLLNRSVETISYASIEQLCLWCNCTPDELFVWKKEENQDVPDNHPLYKLKPKPRVASPMERIKKLPGDKLEKLQAFIDGLEKE